MLRALLKAPSGAAVSKLILQLLVFLSAVAIVGCPDPDPDPDPEPEPEFCLVTEVYLFGACRPACVDNPCPDDLICYDSYGCAPPEPCAYVDCESGEACVEGTCIPSCTTDQDCTEGTCVQGGICDDDLCSDIRCPDGETCVAGQCRTECGTDFACQSGESCIDGVCAEDKCDTVLCPANNLCYEGACYGGCMTDDDCGAGLVCEDNSCADPCASVTCGAGETCVLGECEQTCTTSSECPVGQACGDGTCTSDLCADIDCPGDQTCYQGSCYDVCADDGDCTPPNLCHLARCAEDPCDGVQCPNGTTCHQGSCKETCDGGCPADTVCFDGNFCDDDPCEDNQCPDSQVCHLGKCFDSCITVNDCPDTQSCWQNFCAETPCSGVDCPVGEVCFDGSCYEVCTADPECDGGLNCNGQVCKADACDGVLCPVGESCYEGACYAVCQDDGDCSPPNVCFDLFCQPQPCLDGTCTDPTACDCPLLSDGTPAAGSLAMDVDSSFYAFEAQEGELFTIEATTPDTSASLVVYDPDSAPVEATTFNSDNPAWIPFRAPQTGTYFVRVGFINQTGGDFQIEVTSYGLETPTDGPGFVGTTATTNPNESFYFFAKNGTHIAADVIPADSSAGGQATIEFLQPDGTWDTNLQAISSYPTSERIEFGFAASVTGTAPRTSIFRIRVQRFFTLDPFGIRLDTIDGTVFTPIELDTQGTCGGNRVTAIPRLAVAVGPSDLTICPGTHVEYDTIRTMGTSNKRLIGQDLATTFIELAPEANVNNNFFSLDGDTNFEVENVTFSLPDEFVGTAFDLRGGTTGFTLRDVAVEAGTSSFSRPTFVGVIPAADGTAADDSVLERVDVSGAMRLGFLEGDDISIRDSRFVAIAPDSQEGISIRGDRAIVENSTFGSASDDVFEGGLALIGDDVTFRDNEVYLSTFPVLFTAGNSSTGTNRVSNVAVEDSTFVSVGPLTGRSLVEIRDVDGLEFRRNRIDSSGNQHAVGVFETSGNFINNRVNGDQGVVLYYEYTDDPLVPLSFDIIHNTFRFDAAGTGTVIELSSANSTSNPAPVNISNNILRNEAAVPSTVDECPIVSDEPIMTTRYLLYDNFAEVPCLGSLSATIGTNSFVGDSLLNADLTLGAQSDAIDAADPTNSVAADFEGDARPNGSAPDIGADEF